MSIGPHTITVRRATVADDALGNETRQWGTATSTVVPGCYVYPVRGDEQTVGRQTVVSRWGLVAELTTDLEATDRVEWDGDTYDVDTEVQRWDDSALPSLTALLRRSHSS